MRHFGIGYHLCGEYAVGIACLRRHQAVGGKQHRRRQLCKFLLLILPCCAEVALEMRIFFQFGIAMCRQHFAMGINIDTPALGLLQQQLEIMQIVTGNHNKRSLFHSQRNGNRCGRAVAFGICLIQKRHALEVFLTDLHHDGQQLLHAPILADSKKRLCEEIVHRIIGIAQHQRMMRIGRHAAHPEQNQGFQAADILLRIPEPCHIVIGSATARSSAVRTVRHKPCLFRMYAVNQLAQCLFVEAYICNGGK